MAEIATIETATGEPLSTMVRAEESPVATLREKSAEDDGSSEATSEDIMEEDEVLITDSMREEERQLHERREDHVSPDDNDSPALQEPAALPKDTFGQLDQLLNKSLMYSQFLQEQMQNVEKEAEATAAQEGLAEDREEEGEDIADVSSRRGKRRASAGRGKGAAKAPPKKQAKGAPADDEASRTRLQAELCPLIEGGTLRSYQLQGVKWMISLWQNGLNGILADDMGLGKTLQTISFLSHLICKGVNGPFLIVAPLSTLSSWVSEFGRWAPKVPAQLFHGNKEERVQLRAKYQPRAATTPEFPVMVTSYEIVINDISYFSKFTWKYIIVDEGHRLKNFDCKLLRELRRVPALNKLLLTGTPLQNNLDELWSLLNFIMPNVFQSLTKFQSWFAITSPKGGLNEELILAEQRRNVVTKLHSVLRPFLLRRCKADVEKSLPKKREFLLYADMSPQQVEFRDALLNRTLVETLEGKDTRTGAGKAKVNRSILNNMLMQLRKNANHPLLISSPFEEDPFYPPTEELIRQSGKMKLLDRLLTKLKARGHKVLIFSQMTKMLDVVEIYLEDRGHGYCRIDGSVPADVRRQQIHDFHHAADKFVFLLSTRAGGLGINLTCADTVIIFDSDWNPHQDLQAMDRCHRIGQTRPVHVYRLVTGNSVEGRMLELASNKLALERVVIRKGNFVAAAEDKKTVAAPALDVDELREMLESIKRADSNTVAQSGAISEDDLERLLDRDDLINAEGQVPAEGHSPAGDQAPAGVNSPATCRDGAEPSGAAAKVAASASPSTRGGAKAKGKEPLPLSGKGYEVIMESHKGFLSSVQ